MKQIFINVINRGGFDLYALLAKIDVYHVEGKLSDAEREELYALANEKAQTAHPEIVRIWKAIEELRVSASDSDEQKASI
ncbi:MAG: hypothetical protein IJY04_04880 [Clostridia bacterium]|nr:hypothetical protein [Clostridia bacterium]